MKASQETLCDLTRAIMESLQFHVDEASGRCCMVGEEDQVVPLVLENREVFLPSHAVLKRADWDREIAFNPFQESAVRGDSVTLAAMTNWIRETLFFRIKLLTLDIAELLVDTDRHAKLTPQQREFVAQLSAHGSLSPQNLKVVRSILNKSSTKGDRRLLQLFLKRGTVVGMEGKFTQTAVVSFPFIEELSKDGDKVWDTKVSGKVRNILRAILTYIFPLAVKPNAYSFGTNCLSAPRCHAMLHAFANVSAAINKAVEAMRGAIEYDDIAYTNLDWIEAVTNENITQWRALVACTPGNEGDEPIRPGAQSTEGNNKGAMTVTTQQAQAVNPQPATQPAPQTVTVTVPEQGKTTVNNDNKMANTTAPKKDWKETIQGNFSQPGQPCVGQPGNGQVMLDQYNRPIQVNPQMMQPQMQQPMYNPQAAYQMQPNMYGQMQPQMNLTPGQRRALEQQQRQMGQQVQGQQMQMQGQDPRTQLPPGTQIQIQQMANGQFMAVVPSNGMQWPCTQDGTPVWLAPQQPQQPQYGNMPAWNAPAPQMQPMYNPQMMQQQQMQMQMQMNPQMQMQPQYNPQYGQPQYGQPQYNPQQYGMPTQNISIPGHRY